jgi:hypothetical protein
VAEGQRVIIINKIDKWTISGTNAIYLAASDTVTVTGSPNIHVEKGNVNASSETAIIWDRRSNTVRFLESSKTSLNPKAFQKSDSKTDSPRKK